MRKYTLLLIALLMLPLHASAQQTFASRQANNVFTGQNTFAGVKIEWSSSVPAGGYNAGAIVSYMGSLYQSIAGGNLNHLPTLTMYWTPVSSVGGASGGWPFSDDSIQYVSANGDDANDGLSPGTAKLTWTGACEALVDGSSSAPLTCGKGTIYVIGTVAAQPDATKGRWLMGPEDTQWASPPTGWHRYSSAYGIRTVCMGGEQYIGPHGSQPLCVVTGGGAIGAYGLWLSGLIGFEDEHIALGAYILSPVMMGLDSNRVNTNSVSGVKLTGFSNNFGACGLGGGPGIDITGNSFWIYILESTPAGCIKANWEASLSRTSGVVTATTTTTNDYAVGDWVIITHATDDSFDGAFVVTGVSGSPQTSVTWAQALPNDTSAYGSLFSRRSFAISVDPRGSNGSGLIYVDNAVFSDGGVYAEAGTEAVSLFLANSHMEGNPIGITPPLVVMPNANGNFELSVKNVVMSDAPLPVGAKAIAVAVYNGCFPDSVLIEGVFGGSNQNIGCATVFGQGANALPGLVKSPQSQQQAGLFGGRLNGTTDAAARMFPPTRIRYQNVATNYAPATWIYDGGGVITTGIAAPDGTTGAGRATSTSGLSFVQFYQALDVPVSVGDSFIYSVWARSYTGNVSPRANFQIGFGGYGIGDACTRNDIIAPASPILGDGEWVRMWGICTIAAAPANAGLFLGGNVYENFPMEFYAPTIFKIAAGGVSTNEAWEIASNLSGYSPTCTVGQICTAVGPLVSDTAYDATSWNGNSDPPTKNSVRDKIETLGSSTVDDTAYDATSWNGVTTIAPSKNAVRDEVEVLIASIPSAPSDTAYNAGTWDAVTTIAPSKNAVRDEFETVIASVTAAVSDTVYGAGWNGVTTIAPSKNAVYDKVEAVVAAIPVVSDTAYDATTWNANTDAATKNAIRDKIEALGVTGPGTTTGDTRYCSTTATPCVESRIAIGATGDYYSVVGGVPAWSTAGIVPNAQTGTTYTWLTGDRGKVVWQNNGSATAYTLPQAGSAGFTSNWYGGILNVGAGLVTVTPTTSTINGAATAIVPQNWYSVLHSDNTNYRAPIMPTIGAFPNCTDTGGNHLNFTSATGALSCGTSGGAAGARFTAGGDVVVAGDIALGAGWGSTAAVSAVTGHDQAFNFTVTTGGTGIAANPTFTMTFTDGTWTLSPIFQCQQTGGNDTLSDVTFTNGVTTATTVPGIWNGTPTTAKTYIITCIGVGR